MATLQQDYLKTLQANVGQSQRRTNADSPKVYPPNPSSEPLS